MSFSDKLLVCCCLLPIGAILAGWIVGRFVGLRLAGASDGERKKNIRQFALSGVVWLPVMMVFPKGALLYSLLAALIALYGAVVAFSLHYSRKSC
jgi:hypothetical protein